MSTRNNFIVGSVVAHVALGIGLGRIQVKESHAATAIEIANIPKAKKAEPAKVEPVMQKQEPVHAPVHHAAPTAPAPAQNTPPPQAPVAATAEALPDFGLSLSGGVGGDGVSIPTAGAPIAPVTTHQAAVKRALSAAPIAAANACDEPMVKPKPISVPQPAYSTAARAASIEGKVRVRLTVDETGKVVAVSILQGLGYGLDEAALAAAREATFEPATQCGKPVSATFTISMRFSAG